MAIDTNINDADIEAYKPIKDQCFRLIGQGYTNLQISSLLDISYQSVQQYRKAYQEMKNPILAATRTGN